MLSVNNFLPAFEMDTSSEVTLSEVTPESKKRRRRRKRVKRQANDTQVMQNMGQMDRSMEHSGSGLISSIAEGSKQDTTLEDDLITKLTHEHPMPDGEPTTNPLEKSVKTRKRKKKRKAIKNADGVYGPQDMDHTDILSKLSLADACNGHTAEGSKQDATLEDDLISKLTQEHPKPDRVSTTNPLEKSVKTRKRKKKRKAIKNDDGMYGPQDMDHTDILSKLSLADACNGHTAEGSKQDATLEDDLITKLTQEHPKPDRVSTTNPLEKSVKTRKRKKKRKAIKNADGMYGPQDMDHTDILSKLSLADACNGHTAEGSKQDATLEDDLITKLTQEHPMPDRVSTTNPLEKSVKTRKRKKKRKAIKNADGMYGPQDMDHTDILSKLSLADACNGHTAKGSKQDSSLEDDLITKLTQEHPKPDRVSTTNPLEKSVKTRKRKKKRKAIKNADGMYGPQDMDHTDILSNLMSLADACDGLTNGTINQIMATEQESGFSMTKESVISTLECVHTEYVSNVANGAPNLLVVPRHFTARSPVCSRRKLLILDINGLLADIVKPPPRDCKADTRISGRAIFKRPFYYDFLKFCCENFDVGIWSSRSKVIIHRVVDYLLGDLKHKLLFCWDMYQCTKTGFKTLENRHKPLVCKELRKLWEKHYPNLPWEKGDYDESNTLLIDDSPYKALLNPIHTAIFPHSYSYGDKSDNSLGPGGNLRVYLEGLVITENIQKYIEQHPFGQRAIDETSPLWGFYSMVLCNMSAQSTNK